MPKYTFLTGEMIDYPDPPREVADYLQRAKEMAADPTVDVAAMEHHVYGIENPMLDRNSVPGRAVVTRAVNKNPVYQILVDLIGVKRVNLGQINLDQVAARYTVSMEEAASELGISPAQVRKAILGRELAGHMKNGEWFTRPSSIVAYRGLYLNNRHLLLPDEPTHETGITLNGTSPRAGSPAGTAGAERLEAHTDAP